MIKLKINHHKTFIETDSEEDLKAIKKTLRVWQDFFQKNSPQKFKYTSLFYSYDKSFPTGFLEEVKKKLTKKGVSFEIEDQRLYIKPYKKFEIDKTFLEDLWENQEKALDAIKKNEVGLISSPTGTGKTRIIANAINIRKVKTLVIVPTTSIQKQMYKLLIAAFGKDYVSMEAPKYKEQQIIKKIDSQDESKPKENIFSRVNKIKINDLYDNDNKQEKKNKFELLYGDENKEEEIPYYLLTRDQKKELRKKKKEVEKLEKYKQKQKENYQKQIDNLKNKKITLNKSQVKQVYGHDITVICFQSLPLLSKDFLDSIECVLIDECHHASADTIRLTLDKMKNTCYRYGFSATIWRDKNDERQLLKAALGNNILYNISGVDAINKGIVVRPELIYISSPTPEVYLLKTKHWHTILKEGIVLNKTRNKSIVKNALELYRDGHNVFIAVDQVAHLEELKNLFLEKKINVLCVHGQQNEKINDENIKIIGETDGPLISIGTMAVGEGTDMPCISAIILASGGKASIKFLQRIGRGTRKTQSKKGLLVVDYEDWFNPTLKKHTKQRKEVFSKYYSKIE